MGDVVKFRRARLTGFIPDDLGEKHKPEPASKPITLNIDFRKLSQSVCDMLDRELVEFAKRGAPPDPDCA